MGSMMLTSKHKALIRWLTVSFISFFYYLMIGGVAAISFDREVMFFPEKIITVEYHRAALGAMLAYANTVMLTAFIAFPLCTILIIVVIKRIR